MRPKSTNKMSYISQNIKEVRTSSNLRNDLMHDMNIDGDK